MNKIIPAFILVLLLATTNVAGQVLPGDSCRLAIRPVLSGDSIRCIDVTFYNDARSPMVIYSYDSSLTVLLVYPGPRAMSIHCGNEPLWGDINPLADTGVYLVVRPGDSLRGRGCFQPEPKWPKAVAPKDFDRIRLHADLIFLDERYDCPGAPDRRLNYLLNKDDTKFRTRPGAPFVRTP